MPYTRRQPSMYQKARRLYNTMSRVNKDPKGSQFSKYELAQISKAKKASKSIERRARTYTSKPPSKRIVWDEAANLRNGNVLYTLTPTSRILQDGSLNGRERQDIFVKGMKVTGYVRNETDSPKVLRWAVVQEKGQNDLPPTTDFYIGTNDLRTVDFDSVASGLHHVSYTLNHTRWNVLAQGVKELSARTVSTTAPTAPGSIPSYTFINEYVNIGGRVTYHGDALNADREPIRLMYWLADPLHNDTTPQLAQMFIRWSTVTYFVDP